ncbi:MAG: hypothetical protein AAFO82_00735 [Bacteroidota bacterium]
MKKISLIATLLIIAFSFATVSATANYDVEPIVKIRGSEQQSSIDVFLANLQQETTYLEITDFQGNRIYEETITDQRAYAKKLNLSEVIDGDYLLLIENDRIEVTQPVAVERGIVKILAEKRTELLAPKIDFIEDAVFFQLAPHTRSQKVTISIWYGEEIIYESKDMLTTKIRKRYKLGNLDEGIYTFKAMVNGKSYYEEIDLTSE